MQRIGQIKEDQHQLGAALLAVLAPVCYVDGGALRVSDVDLVCAIDDSIGGTTMGHRAEVRTATLALFDTAGVNLQEEDIGAQVAIADLLAHVILMQR